MIDLVALETTDPAAVEQLLDRAFGPDRHLRTAYRVRAGISALSGLSFAATEEKSLVGTIQCWRVALTLDAGGSAPLVMVGPVAVLPERQRDGIGRVLTQASLAAADACGLGEAMMLIGDPEYYERFFGFSAARTGAWRLPGAIERHRLLARGSAVPDGAGLLGPRVA